MLGTTRILNDISRGSRTVFFLRKRIFPLFLVGDYLDHQAHFEATMLESSLVWKRLKKTLDGILETLSWRNIGAVTGGSAVARSLISTGIETDRINPRRGAMALFATFVLWYYMLRTLLLFFIPGAYSYAGWAGGLILGFLLVYVYLYLAKNTGRDA